MQMRGKERKQEARKGTGLLPVIQVEIFFSKKWGDGNGNKQWTGETLRRRSKQDLSHSRIRGNGKRRVKEELLFFKKIS